MIRAWLQILRLPNFFTLPGDTLVGWLFACGTVVATHDVATTTVHKAASIALPSFPWHILCASAALYAFGLIQNDLTDLAIDRTERPARPLPSGRLTPRAAKLAMGALLLTAGALCIGDRVAILFAVGLAATISLYNLWAKHIPVVGILVMGLCRGLNVAFAAGTLTVYAAWLLAGYIVLLSCVAKDECAPKYGVCYVPALFLCRCAMLVAWSCFIVALVKQGGAVAHVGWAYQAVLLLVCITMRNRKQRFAVVPSLLWGYIVMQAAQCGMLTMQTGAPFTMPLALMFGGCFIGFGLCAYFVEAS